MREASTMTEAAREKAASPVFPAGEKDRHGLARREPSFTRRRVEYVKDLDKIPQLTPSERAALKSVGEKFVFRANDYYLNLVNWDDPNDPIRNVVIPRGEELEEWGELDASDEAAITVAKGAQHKYAATVLLLVNEMCGAYCRFCFRKRLFMEGNDETTNDISEGLDYIRSHPEVSNVLLTGGDPMILSTRRLAGIFEQLRAIPHVRIIRIGTKMVAFNPFRFSEDPDLLALFKKHSRRNRRVYIMGHFNHPRELTAEAREGLKAIIDSGAIPVNQTPLLAHVNDDPGVLAELFSELSFMGVPPYYLFQCRPTEGNKFFDVPITRGYKIFEEAKKRCSGLAKRARYSMSHALGKIQIAGVTRKSIYLKFHQCKNPDWVGRFMAFKRDDEALWFDDLLKQVGGDPERAME